MLRVGLANIKLSMKSKKPDNLLSASDIVFNHGENRVLSKVSLSLNNGEVLGIAGESGSGKTTLLKILAAKLAPDEGHIMYEGEDIYKAHNQLLRGHEDIKIVDQDFDLMPFITVDENILRNALSLSEGSRKRLLGHLKNNLKLRPVGNQKAVNTSGGQKQRVALATAVASGPQVLILDEPFANLDYALKLNVIALLKEQWKPKAMIVVAHEPADLLGMSTRLLILQKGKVIQTGLVKEVYKNPKNLYTAKLLGPVNELSKDLRKALDLPEGKNWVRPHELELGKSGVKAEVKSIHFCGSYNEVILKTEEYDQLLTVHYDALMKPPGKGDMIFVCPRKINIS